MKEIQASNRFENICYDIRGPVLDEAERMAAHGIDIIKLNTGNPGAFGFNTSDVVVESLKNSISAAQAYTQSKGILPAREAIAAYCKRKGIPHVSPEDVYTGNGVSELIMMCMQALLNTGDEVLVPSPDYPLWTASVTLAGGTPVHYTCDELSEWQPDIGDLHSKITPRTKALVIINPNNPTGALYEPDILQAMTELARQHGLILFSDEIYDRLVMDGLQHISTASLAPDLPVITLNGLSKSHLIAGFRCGWMSVSGNKKPIRPYIEALNMMASMRLCSNALSQFIIPAALADLDRFDPLLAPGGRIYEQREVIMEGISRIPMLSAVRPKAAFYLFPKLNIKKQHIIDDERFVLDFLKAHHVLLVHGRGFHWPYPDHFRIVYLPDVGQLRLVMQRLACFLDGYHQ